MGNKNSGRRPGPAPPIGTPFGKLTVDSLSSVIRNRSVVWCKCECGSRTIVRVNSLLTENTKSCGCTRHQKLLDRNTKHGASCRRHVTPEYRTWAMMCKRCNDSDNPLHKNYGGRGISVCDRWNESFENFLADMGPRPSYEMSIDRINVNGNYEPGNCRWATDKEQANNTRRNRRITFNGLTLTLNEWAVKIGIGASGLHARLARMPMEKALTMPPKKPNKDKHY